MTGIFRSSSQDVLANPTTPPAGPEMIDLSPEKLLTSTKVPSEVMNSTLAPPFPLLS